MSIYTGSQRVAAFALVGVMLVVAADYETTAGLAVAFAYLILLTALYYVGPVAFARLQDMIGAGVAGKGSVPATQANPTGLPGNWGSGLR